MISWIRRLFRREPRIRYVKGVPWVVGRMCHFMPMDCWTESEKQSLKFNVWKMQFERGRWVRVEEMLLSRDELNELMKSLEG